MFEQPKKVKQLAGNDFSSLVDYMSQFNSEAAIIDDYRGMEPDLWIHTGNYIYNAQISGSLERGFPSNKMILIGGDPKTGKSYLAYEMANQALAAGYDMCMLFETENSPDKERMRKQVPIKKILTTKEGSREVTPVMMYQPNTPVEITDTLMPMLDDLLKKFKAGKPTPKLIVIIDSISALSSEQEKGNAIKGTTKTDVGARAKELGQMLNLIMPYTGKLQIPIILTAHVYDEQDMTKFIKEKKISGGRKPVYMSSFACLLTKRFETEKDEDNKKERTGIFITSHVVESRYSNHIPVNFRISFRGGMHKYLGLEDYLSWDICGIDKGKFIDMVDFCQELIAKKLVTSENAAGFEFNQKDLEKNLSKAKQEYLAEQIQGNLENGVIEPNKKNPEMWVFTKETIKRFDKEGKYSALVTMVGAVNRNINQYIVKHSGKIYPKLVDVLTPEVITPEVIKQIDSYIQPKFKLGEEDIAARVDQLSDEDDEILERN